MRDAVGDRWCTADVRVPEILTRLITFSLLLYDRVLLLRSVTLRSVGVVAWSTKVVVEYLGASVLL
jgi:hypothetical protein